MDKINVALICNKNSWLSKCQKKLLERQLIILFCSYENITFYTTFDSVFEADVEHIVFKLKYDYGLYKTKVEFVFLHDESFSMKRMDVVLSFVPFPLSYGQVLFWYVKYLNKKYGKPKIINIVKQRTLLP